MSLNRRRFLASAGMSVVEGSLASARATAPAEPKPRGTGDLQDWPAMRD